MPIHSGSHNSNSPRRSGLHPNHKLYGSNLGNNSANSLPADDALQSDAAVKPMVIDGIDIQSGSPASLPPAPAAMPSTGSGMVEVQWCPSANNREWPAHFQINIDGQFAWLQPVKKAEDLDAQIDQAADKTGSDPTQLRTQVTEARLAAASRHFDPQGVNADPTAESNSSSPLANLDQQFQQWVAEIAPDWGPGQRGQHLTKLASLIDIHLEFLDPSSCEELRQAASEALKKHGQGEITKKRFRELLNSVHQSRAARRRLTTAAQLANSEEAEAAISLVPPPRYQALSQIAEASSPEAIRRYGIRDCQSDDDRLLTNFEVLIDENHECVDEDAESATIFFGHLRSSDRNTAFRISAKDYAQDAQLKAKLYQVGGSSLHIDCKMDELRNAINVISPSPARRRYTTDFGWSQDGTAYRVPGACITADGYQQLGDDDVRLDLSECEQVVHLSLQPVPADQLLEVKKHIVNDLLALHDRTVTQALLGLTAAAVLRQFSGVAHRFAGWLVGDTGTGKTLLSRLFMGFFGAYRPGEDNRFASWCWTPNAIEKAGYYFRDALFLVDDFKTGTTWHNQIVRLLQAYGDGSARGRLKSDASFNAGRPIRGLLLATGENTVDHESSTKARTVLIRVEAFENKDLERRQRCLDTCSQYSGVMADFLAWLLKNGRTGDFAKQVRGYQARYYQQVHGQPNDARVAANLAVLAAAHAQFAEYLGEDAWPVWEDEVKWFGEECVPAMLSQMMVSVREQRPIEIFWNTLVDQVRCGRVRFDEYESHSHAPVIGKYDFATTPARKAIVWVSTEMALAEVQKSLRDQGRPPLPLRPQQIPELLKKEGKLLDRSGQPIPADAKGSVTQQRRLIPGEPAKRGFILAKDRLCKPGIED
jgi:hypothetical protein